MSTQASTRQTIRTKYLSVTNHRPVRFKATSSGGCSLILGGEELSLCNEPAKNHALVARTLAETLGWKGDLVGGNLDAHGDVMVWVFTS